MRSTRRSVRFPPPLPWKGKETDATATQGEGTFGKVKKALNTESGEWVAIKVLDKEKIQKQNMGQQVKKEISIMKLVRHKHIVSLKEVLASRTKIFIVLELVTGGELFDKIVAEGKFNETVARKYFQQLVAGTAYCHKQGVCHRDLKPENLLLDEHEDLKISDFGLSSLYEQAAGETDRATLLHTTCGTPNYVAPEVLADKGYDGAMADTWSCGGSSISLSPSRRKKQRKGELTRAPPVILFVFLAGFLPFDEATMSALFRKIQKAEFTYPSWFTDEVKDLISHILVVDPKQRWTLSQIRQHPWWKKDGPYALHDPTQDQKQLDLGGGDGILDDVEDDEGGSPAKAAAAASGGGAASPAAAGGGGGAGAGPRLNAFDIINMCSGSAANKLFHGEGGDRRVTKMLIAPSNKPYAQVVEIVSDQLRKIPGFQSIDGPSDEDKLRAIFDLGNGQVHVKVAINPATDDLTMVVFKRARGDALSFRDVWEHVAKIPAVL